VDATPEGGKPAALYFDPRTFLIVREQHLDDNVPVTTTFGDYRAVDGARFPFRTATTNGTARYDMAATVTRLENNVALPPDLFAPPPAAGGSGFVHPGQTSATVPFEMDDGEIGLNVTLDGQPARVFLDSGASGIALSQATAARLGLKSDGFLEARGYGGSTDLHPVRLGRLEVPGAVALTDVAAIAVDLPDTLNSYFSRPVAGFVGYDLLAHFVVRVDFARRRITFTKPDAFHPGPRDGRALPVELDNSVPSVSARLDALPAGRFLLDTGDASALRLYGPFVARYGLDRKYPRGVPVVGGGIGGVSRARVARVGALQIAGVTLRGVPADFSLDPKGGASQVNAGALGVSLLSRFVVTFDYPHGRVFLAPTAQAAAPFETRTTGLTLAETRDPRGRAHVVVAEVQAGAPALRAGLNAYDEVLAIDGVPTARLGLAESRRRLSPRPGAAAHTLRVQSTVGKPRTVRAALFDPLR
jgi:predicted aspartyl protease